MDHRPLSPYRTQCKLSAVLFSISIIVLSFLDFTTAALPNSYSTDIECYERAALGKRLNSSDISTNVTLGTVRLCEQECERMMCQAFSFGISKGGNGTCELADKRPTAEAVVDLEYDLFYKNPRCLNKTSCFRRLASGRSLIDKYVRKTLYCDSLRSCEEACAQEIEFTCEGFNFRFDRSGYEQSKCQLTDVPSVKLSVTSDFNADIDFDFYEKDRDAPRTCFFPFLEFRPWTGYGQPGGGGGGGYGRPGGYHPNYIPHREPPPPLPPSAGDGAYYHHRYPPQRPQYPPLHHHEQRPPDDRPPGGGGGGPQGRPPPPPPPPPRPPGGSGPPYPASGEGGTNTAVGGYGWNNQIGVNQAAGGGGGGPTPSQPSPTWQWDYYPYRYGDRGGYEYGGFGGGHPAYGLGSGWGLPDECFIRSRTGFRLDRPIVIVSMSVPSLYDCEYRCVNERKFTCNVFSFRYSMSPSVPGDNCHLGERSYRSLDIYTDIIPDRDYDIYERNPNRREGCQPKRFWGSDCFERIRSGLKLKNPIVKYAMKARSLSDCESACINIPYFTCRAFSYRYGPPIIGESIENCLLTDWPLPEMNIQKHFEIDPECELYHRGSYGHGCEISRYPETVIGGYLPPTPPGGYLDASARPPPGRPPPSSPGEYPGHYRPGNEIHGSFVHHEKYPTGGGGYFIPPNQPSGDYLRPGKFPPPDGGYLPPNKYYPPYPPVEKPHLPPPKGEYPPPLPPPPPPPHRKPTGTYIPPEKPPGLGYLPPDNKLPPSSHGGGYLPPDKPPPGYYKHHGAGATGEGYHFSSGDNKAHSGGYLPPPVKPPLPPPIDKPLHHGAGGGYFGEDKHHHHYGASGGGGAEGGYHLGPPSKYYDYYYDRRPEEHHGNEYYHFLSGKPVHPGYLPPPNTQFSSGKYGVDGVYRPRPSDQLCYIRYSTPARLLPPAIKTSLWVPSEQDCKESCTRAREKTRFRCATLSYRDGQCELSDIEQRDLRPGYDYLQDKSFWMFTWDFGTASCYHPPPPGKPPLITDPWGDRGVESTWSHFTVNGQPCRVGTVCTMNREVGVWTCPIDNGDWDYCCRSGHHCGYSDGYSYPWCYVGSADRDQWRPCSDSYYPYAHSGRKLHWPVAYLHKEGPPNVTLTPSARTFTNEYKPSIVETFLRSLVREVENNSTNSSNNVTDITDSTPMFEQIDLIEPSKKSITSNDTSSSAMEKLWMWGQSMYNSTNDQQNTTNNEILSDPTNSTITADPTTNNVIKL